MYNSIIRFVVTAAMVGACASGLSGGDARRSEKEHEEEKLIAVLASEAPFREKADACRKLARIGSRKAVPQLVALLTHEKLSHMARYALEPIPDPAVDAALRNALGTLKGRALVGVIGSIGVRRDTSATDALAARLQDADSDVFISEQVLVVKEPNSDRTMIELVAGGQEMEKVARLVQNAVVQIAQQYLTDEQFGGQIHVRFVPEITPEAQAREAIPSIESHLNGVIQEAGLRTAQGEPIQIRLFYGASDQ